MSFKVQRNCTQVKLHACKNINESTERRPRVPHYQSSILSTVIPLLHLHLPEPASRTARKAAQYFFRPEGY